MDFLRFGPKQSDTGEPRKAKATKSARSVPAAKAAEAAEKRATPGAGPRTKQGSTATRKPAQLDSRQSTLTVSGYRKSSRLANSDRPIRQYSESSPQSEQDRVVVSAYPPVDKKQLYVSRGPMN